MNFSLSGFNSDGNTHLTKFFISMTIWHFWPVWVFVRKRHTWQVSHMAFWSSYCQANLILLIYLTTRTHLTSDPPIPLHRRSTRLSPLTYCLIDRSQKSYDSNSIFVLNKIFQKANLWVSWAFLDECQSSYLVILSWIPNDS